MSSPAPPPLPHAGKEYTIETLVSAVQFGDLGYVRDAIQSNVELARATDSGGCSLLHWAAINNRRGIAHLLMQHGADVNLCGGKLQEIPLQWAVRNDKFTGVAQYLIEAGSNLSHRSMNGLDALHVACRMGNVNMAFLILSANANPNSRDGDGNTILHFLLKTQHEWDSFDLQRLLVSSGTDVALTDVNGNNALHLMALAGRPFTDARLALMFVNTLNGPIAIRGVLSAKNNDGMTVYQAALVAKNSTMMNFWIDMHLKMLLPTVVPTVASSLCTAAPFIALYIWGWSWITPVAAVVAIFFLQKLTLGSISSSRTGFAWGTIATAEASYFINVAVHYDIVVNTIVTLIGLTICYTLFRSTTTQTVCLPKATDRRALVEAVALAGLVDGPSTDPLPIDPAAAALGMVVAVPVHVPRLCTTCLADKTKATMHCSRCNICVVSLDHHCPFVDNCVGKGNRRVFVFFCFSASFGCMINVFLSWIVQFVYTCPAYQNGLSVGAFPLVQVCVAFTNPFFAIAPWLALVMSLWIFALCFHQLWMVAASTTTYDMVKGLHDGSGNNCQSSMSNLRDFFVTGHFNVQPRRRIKGCKSCPSGHPHTHGHAHTHGHTPSPPPPASAGSSDMASLAASTMGSLSVSMAPMVLADTDATPLLDGEADTDSPEGDPEEGTFLGSKHKVTAAAVTSSESDASFAAESGPSMPTRHASAAAAASAASSSSSGGAGAYTLMAMAQQSQFMRRLFFASSSSPGERKKDDDSEGEVVMGQVGGGGGSWSDRSASASASAHHRSGSGSGGISRSSSGSAV